MEIYKGLVQWNYKGPANGDFSDCTKEVLADLQAKRKGVENTTKRCFQGRIVAVPNI